MVLLQLFQFSLLFWNILADNLQFSVTDGQQLINSIENLTKNCDQSKNYVGILDAVHHSLDLQVSWLFYCNLLCAPFSHTKNRQLL